MERSRASVYGLALVLLVTGIGVMLYKVLAMGFPLSPGESRIVWTLESKITFKPDGGPVETLLALPQPLAGWDLLDEYFASSGLGFSIENTAKGRHARWTRKQLSSSPTLYYKLQIARDVAGPLPPLPVAKPRQPSLEADARTAMKRLVRRLDLQAAEPADFVTLLINELNLDTTMQETAYLLSENDDSRVALILEVLAWHGIPAHRLRGVFLQDGRRRQTVTELVEAHTGNSWQVFNPSNGESGLPDDFFVWVRGNAPILDVMGGHSSRLRFAMLRNSLPVKTVLAMQRPNQEYPLIDFSVYSLPVEHQGVLKAILLIPIGALVVVLMRVVVGIPTSGTFMPILIALAFIQTQLLPGLMMFVLVVAVGLWIRSLLSHLNLLLVPRISAVIIVVVLLMTMVSIASYKFGWEQALTVTLFPTIILSWTIERMSILWEEQGAREVLLQGGGSLLVAVVTYLLMTNRYLVHLSFNFPESLIALLGLILLIGQYRGYRLTELYRFRHLGKQ